VLGLLPVAGARDDLAPKALDLVAGGVAEAPVEGFSRVELLAVDEQRARAGQRVAVLVEVCGTAPGGRWRMTSSRPRSRGGSRR
jgi:hypothetical protein